MSVTAHPLPPALDVARIRRDFPIFLRKMHGKPLVFLDSAASAQKPRAVIDAVTNLYETGYANVHRGIYQLSQEATEAYEGAREKVRGFLNAETAAECIFVRNATEAVNLVAQSYGRHFLQPGDEIILSEVEHHSNIVPWQLLRDDTGIVIRVAPVTDEGALDFAAFEKLLTPKTKLVAMVHVSNALGTTMPVERVIARAHEAGAKVLIDGCQAAPHRRIDVRALGADFYVFTGHKVYGPTGIGVLYAKAPLLDEMPPWQGGGDMIELVTFEKTTYNVPPQKFEAGTPNIAGAIGLGAAIDYVSEVGFDAISAHEHDVLEYATASLSRFNSLRIIGTAPGKSSIVSFVLEGIHPHDVGTILDQEGIAVRTGHHCAQPAMERFGVPATVRASFGIYNDRKDVDRLVAGIEKTLDIFGQ